MKARLTGCLELQDLGSLRHRADRAAHGGQNRVRRSLLSQFDIGARREKGDGAFRRGPRFPNFLNIRAEMTAS